jgi:hypothetical protein
MTAIVPALQDERRSQRNLYTSRRSDDCWSGIFTSWQSVVDTRSNQAQTVFACRGMAMTVATGFSVLFVVAIPIAIVAISLALIGLTQVKDSYQRRKNPA